MMRLIFEQIIEGAAALMREHKDELISLDQAIGDGDHGINMHRGFAALLAEKEAIAVQPLGAALKKAGMILVMKVGGASGPLYGSLFMGMGRAAPVDGALTKESFVALYAAGVAAVQARGKAEQNQKTMLDVLIPVLRELEKGEEIDFTALRACALESATKTKEMKALKGRAAFLGDRSVGHVDPGARSTALLIEGICDILAKNDG